MFIGETIGPFKIERELGSGAMGSVYRATYTKDDGETRQVAFKIVALGLLGNEGAMARFDRESAILKQMKHPNIVRLIATGKYKRTPFIAMEFVDGEALDRVLSRRGRLGWEEVVGYIKQLCSALQYAHEKGIIHRDLKPSNLMITRDGTLKLTDFGIAKDQDVTALTGMNSTIGTAAYMSPEQCKGDKNLSGKSDLYSLGICMYELIVGKKPFTAETTVDMFLKHVNDPPPKPRRFVPDLPVWVETLMLHLLEKDKDKRPLDAATVAKTLAEIEQKVADQASAGLDVASARRVDRKLGEIDETDKDAARALRDAKKGKKRKKKEGKGSPRSLKFLPPVLGLVAIAIALVLIFKPGDENKYFEKVSAAATPDDRIAEAEKFLGRFPNGENAEKAKGILAEAKGQKLDAVIEKRFHSKGLRNVRGSEDDVAYAHAWSALEAEEKGDLTKAAEIWTKVKARSESVKDDYGSGWAWLADKHAADIKGVDESVKGLMAELKEFQVLNPAWKPDATDPKSLALTAIRLGGLGGPPNVVNDSKPLPVFKDDAKARKTWTDLSDMTKEKLSQRGWRLLANREQKNYSDMKPEDALAKRKAELPQQVELIRTEWERVKSDPNADVPRRDCKNRARDVVELFGDESDPVIVKAVESAKKLLDEIQKK